MKKTILLLVLLAVSVLSLQAQNALPAQAGEKGLYLPHTVAPKENFYSIGRLYALSPKDIAAFNGLDMSKGLSIGQTIQIPLTAANLSGNTSGRAVTYTVAPQEGLYRVSQKAGGVTMANLRKWNNLQSDNLNPGQQLVVGYLASEGAKSIQPAVGSGQPAVVSREPARQEPVRREPVRQEEVKEEPVRETPPARPQPRREEPAPLQRQAAVTDANGGYFREQYGRQSRTASAGKDATVTAGIFKTASGWQDAKYYALMDGVEPGTIIQVVNPANSRAIYAKVLGAMSGIRQNAGMEVRISNAAASALEVSDTEKFVVRVAF